MAFLPHNFFLLLPHKAFALTAYIGIAVAVAAQAHEGEHLPLSTKSVVAKSKVAKTLPVKAPPILLQSVRLNAAVAPWKLPFAARHRIVPIGSVKVATSETAPLPWWDLRDALGQRSQLVVVAGRNFTSAWLSEWQKAASALSAPDTKPVLVLSPAQSASFRRSLAVDSSSPEAAPVVLVDKAGSTAARFGVNASTTTLVLIDRAGFLRRVQPLTDADDLHAALTQRGELTPALAEGQAAPDFLLRDMNGELQQLSNYRGRKNLLLTFFPRCFTGGCVVHLTSLRKEYSKLQAAHVEVLAISVDAANGDRGQRAFAKSLNLPFALIPDTGRNLSMLYGAAYSPEQVSSRISILIDKNGIVRWIDKQIDLKTHGADVLKKVQDLSKTSGS